MKKFRKKRRKNLSCAVLSPALPCAVNFNRTNYTTTVIRNNKQHGHHIYHRHCSMVQNVKHNRKKQNHLWHDESTRGAKTPQWWNIRRNVRYIQGLLSAWQRIWKYYIHQSPTKEFDIPHGLGEGYDLYWRRSIVYRCNNKAWTYIWTWGSHNQEEVQKITKGSWVIFDNN